MGSVVSPREPYYRCRCADFTFNYVAPMASEAEVDAKDLAIAQRWCEAKGSGWSVRDLPGRGGTAPVFGVNSPDGDRALKIYDADFSRGLTGQIEEKRIEQQVALGAHDCPYLIKVREGGTFEGRHFLLMDRAPGRGLIDRLAEVPRNKIRTIVNQIAEACIFLRQKGLCHRDIKAENIFVSDTFELTTLLDISVMRDIHDPLGLGTDHSGQLPVVATARYSPPEYLFRLLDPTPEAWHALDVYQLGGLLHDLIMKEPLFQDEYAKSKNNRYRFAWIVATKNPIVEAEDVEQDLVFIARRALDKKWERRSQLSLQDFLSDIGIQQSHALNAIGLSGTTVARPAQTDKSALRRRVNEVARDLEEWIIDMLKKKGVTAKHFFRPAADDYSKRLEFEWEQRDVEELAAPRKIRFALEVSLRERDGGAVFCCVAELHAEFGGRRADVAMDLPDIEDGVEAVSRLRGQAEPTLGMLAARLIADRPQGR
jgi:serine/threonine protein kinase